MIHIYPTKDTLKIGNKYWASWKTRWLWYKGERYHGGDDQIHYYFADISGAVTILTENELPALRITT